MDTITWEKMKKLLMNKYYTKSEVKKLELELLRLEKGSVTIQEYFNDFLEKSRFASYQVATAQRKLDRFMDGVESGDQALYRHDFPNNICSSCRNGNGR